MAIPQGRYVALLNVGAVTVSCGCAWASWRRERHGPVFSFWRQFQDAASKQLQEQRKALSEKSNVRPQQILWLEDAYLRFTGSTPSAAAAALSVNPAGTERGTAATESSRPLSTNSTTDDERAGQKLSLRAPHAQAAALAAARNVHTSEVYITLAGHLIGGIAGWQSRAIQRHLGLRPLMTAAVVGAATGLVARFVIPEVALAGTVGRTGAVEAQREFVRFLLAEHAASRAAASAEDRAIASLDDSDVARAAPQLH